MEGVFKDVTVDREPDLCFVMMPFAEQFNATFRLIERCCTEQGLRCERADSDVRPGRITGKIYDSIIRAGVVIADMTGRNPNVFYELGLAHAISDMVVLLTQSIEDVPFDLRDFVHIQYANSFEGAEKLANELSKVLTRIARSATTPARTAARASVEAVAARTASIDDIDDLDLLHLQAELSGKDGDMAKSREYLERALDLAGSGHGDAGSIGNCAIEAERQSFGELAEALYKLAVERDPAHVNNRQCYVSYLLDEHPADQERLAVASKLLDDLAKEPERQERTKALRAQYATVVSTSTGEENIDAILSELKDGADLTSLEAAAPVLRVLARTGQHGHVRELLEAVKGNVSEEEKLQCDRILADALARSDRPEDEDEAATIYESLLERGTEHAAAVRHNLATLLYNRGPRSNEERAADIWKEAYAELRNDVRMRKAFAQCLLRLGRSAEAKKVLAGEPLAE